MDAETAGRNHWWSLAIKIIKAVYETPITVIGDDWSEKDGLEYLVEYRWYENLPENTAEILLIQLLKEEQMEMDEKIDWMKTLIETATIKPSILETLLKIDPDTPMSADFLEAWLKAIMPSDSVEEREKVKVFCETMSLYEKKKDGEALLWTYGKYAPEVYERYYKNHFMQREPKQKIEYLKTALGKIELRNKQAALLDELVTVYIETDQFDLAHNAELEAFSYSPTYNRYKKMVQICPDKNYLSLFSSDWRQKINGDAWLIEALEGNAQGMIKRLQDENNYDLRKELTVLVGILSKGKIENESLRELIIRFFVERSYYLPNYFDEELKVCQEQVFLFQRAFERIKWNEDDVCEMLDLAMECITKYVKRILSSQQRNEYFRCAQLIGAIKYAMEISGQSNSAILLRQKFEKELRRYRRFKDEFNIWVK